MPKFNFPLSLKPDESSDSLTRLPLHSPRLTASDATDPFPNDQYATYTPNRYSGSSAYSWTPSTPSTGKSEDALLRQGYSMSDSAGLAHFTAGVAPWSQSRLPVLGLLVALALQSILLAGSILVYVHPIERPTGVNIFSLPAKSYNVLVTICGSAISASAALGITIGARSFLSRQLVRGRGITLRTYDIVWSTGSLAFPRVWSRWLFVPLAILLLVHTAASAVAGIFTVSTEPVSSRFELSYATATANLDHYLHADPWANTVLSNNVDFQLFAISVRFQVEEGNPTSWVVTSVDGVATNVGSGLVPSLARLATFRLSLSWSDMLPNRRSDIIRGTTNNLYRSTVPATFASTTCTVLRNASIDESTLSYTLLSTSDFQSQILPNYSLCPNLVVDPVNTTSTLGGGMLACVDGSGGHVAYFTYVGTTFTPQASCFSLVSAGSMSDMIWYDVNSSYPRAWDDALDAEPKSVDVTPLAFGVVGWVGADPNGGTGWTTSQNDLRDLAVSVRKADLPSRNFTEVYSTLTSGLASMAVAKILSVDTASALAGNGWGINATDTRQPRLSNYSATVDSEALVVSPHGLNALWISIIGAMLACLLFSLVETWRFPPVVFNPLDPVAVLLVSVNSPPAQVLEGGGMGDVNKLRSRDVRMKYGDLEGSPNHLAFSFAPHRTREPILGHVYGGELRT